MGVAALLAIAAGCATTRGARSEAEENEAFAAIQTREAEVAAAQRRIDASQGRCPTLCVETVSLCRASDALCDTARELADADALQRCARTRELCAQDRAQGEACDCAATRK